MNDKEGQAGRKFKVEDKRRFDDSGEERRVADGVAGSTTDNPKVTQAPKAGAPAAQKEASSVLSQSSQSNGGTKIQQSSGTRLQPESPKNQPSSALAADSALSQDSVVPQYSNERSEDALDFSSFVVSLATQALMQLGDMQPPSGVRVPMDLEAARQTIDIISMLGEKTKGNLDQAEVQLLKEILHTLRLSYVRRSKPPTT